MILIVTIIRLDLRSASGVVDLHFQWEQKGTNMEHTFYRTNIFIIQFIWKIIL